MALSMVVPEKNGGLLKVTASGLACEVMLVLLELYPYARFVTIDANRK